MILWGASAIIGMLQAWIYSEPATMFGNRSGGISLYAHEGWRRYTTLVGPLSAFGYWIGWSVVLSIFGKIIGDLAQAQWWPHSTWTVTIFSNHLGLPHFIAIGDDPRGVAVQHLRAAPGGVVQLRVRRPADDPAGAVHHRPVLHRRLALLQRARDVHRAVGRHQDRARLHVHPRLVGLRHRGGATFAPEYQDTNATPPRAAQRRDVHAARLRAAAARPRRRHRRRSRRRPRASSTPRR